jgi:hypothetical protein
MKNTKFVILISLISLACSQLKLQCGSSEDFCRDDQTCCALPEGSFGCCPYIDGVCCSDGDHCCPNGYECNLEKLHCDKNSSDNFLALLIPDEDRDNFKLNSAKSNLVRLNFD